MNLRHLATKSINGDVLYSKDLVADNGTLLTHQSRLIELTYNKDEDSAADAAFKDASLDKAILDSYPVLSEMLYKHDKAKPLVRVLSETTLDDYTLDNVSDLLDIAYKMFPVRGDLGSRKTYTPYIPIVITTGCMTPQMKDGKTYFNENGTISVAEFLDGLNAIYHGANSNISRRLSLDNVSTADDYFNEGYRACIRGISSPFFNLYTRKELMEPITRAELAYITVLCWDNFLLKYNNLYGGLYYLGINVDWENPKDILERFEDGFDYKVSKYIKDIEYDTMSLNIKDYKPDELSMTAYKEGIKTGRHAIPLPMFMSILELAQLDLFMFEDSRLDPMKEVSRGEFCYFIYQLANIFRTSR